MKFNKRNLKNLLERNDFRVLEIDFYSNNNMANVYVRCTEQALYYCYIISKDSFMSDTETVWCHYTVFGLETFYKTQLLR